jgi:hypothetical protein
MEFKISKMKLNIFLIKLINFYQKNISRFTKRNCVFYPTCSEYSKQALEKYGFWRGLRLSLNRIGRCHPYTTPQIDNVP